jgi:hypothetical protein
MSTNFIIFGHIDKKLWEFENIRRSVGKAGMCWSQLARVDYINLIPKAHQWPNFGHCYFGHIAVIRRCDTIFWEFYGK